MIKAIIIEDELNAREAMQKMLALLEPNIEIVAHSAYVAEGAELINLHRPDIVFLDIELEDGNGFEILEKVDALSFKLVFTTAYDAYAIKAFKYNALDYLLKPIDPSELENTLKRILPVRHNDDELQKQLSGVKQKEQNQLVLKTTEGTYFFDVQNVLRLEAKKAYTLIVTKDKSILASRNIKYYEKLLGDGFIRCHQSHLVNAKHLKVFDNKSNKLTLSNNEQVLVSSRKKVKITEYFK